MLQVSLSRTCYDVYNLEFTASMPPNNKTTIGPLFPIIIDSTSQSMELKGQVELLENEVYRTRIITVPPDEIQGVASDATIVFSKQYN